MRWNLASRHPPLEKSAGFKEWHQPQLRLKRELFAKSQKNWRSGKNSATNPKKYLPSQKLLAGGSGFWAVGSEIVEKMPTILAGGPKVVSFKSKHQPLCCEAPPDSRKAAFRFPPPTGFARHFLWFHLDFRDMCHDATTSVLADLDLHHFSLLLFAFQIKFDN